MDLATFVQTFANAVISSSIYALVAVGLALSFGVMKMANFAHGEFFMAGAYVVYVLYALAGYPFVLAVLCAVPVVALMGLAAERLIFRPTRDNLLAGFMATAGLSFILQVLAGRIWGVGLMKKIPTPIMGAVDVAGAHIGSQRLVILPVAILTLVALWLFLNRTRQGKALRAAAQKPEAAALQGINLNRMSALAMTIAGASAGLAGALMAPVTPVTPYMGHSVILMAFVVVVLGGMASIQGAMIAAVVLGFVITFCTTLFDGVIATMVGVGIMALVLVVRPQGLMGRETV
ncbi:MAG TPA: branched-chain amino acid ABC transporter permease [Hypericibacter adhaerens]|jgi:branched-chain amino acid transport system permease protein|uniref:Branched-chain amino acid ABC transporter permease n=1 Tax=Hypericibacter adhaerens TaxID=2602016 RepID=A0A5J6N3A2_9PROT|nr:branched-chain amino acid ABC transporter permease [Hypericibacter adhaerens]QEX24261.1 branched-chain amino acid ABC transporter permease [Hypericibacter adhaerens]HWA46065.1 branched-chain amino acid ABC transporter permease [Hypericibacter adhaerens]